MSDRTQKKALAYANQALFWLCVVNYLNYIDRFILAAVLGSVKKDLSLSDFQAGLLATAFMIPYIFTAPIWGWCADRFHRPKLLSFGVMLWSFATVISGKATHFISMALSRFTLGIGESAFTISAPAYLTDFFPPQRHGRALAYFSTALPVGAALGYILGGVLSEQFSWRFAFIVVGLPGLVAAFMLWFLPEPKKDFKVEHRSAGVRDLLKELWSRNDYKIAVLGYCAYTFTVGGLAHWMPSFLQRDFSLSELHANLYFGSAAVGAGLVGTLLGGYLGDRLNEKVGNGHLKISCFSMFLSLPFFYLTVTAHTLSGFMLGLILTEFFLFFSTSPINVVILSNVSEKYRSSAMAFAVLACHILGDAISSPIIGAISDQTGSLRMGMMICLPFILLCAVLWGVGYIILWKPIDWPVNAFELPKLQMHRGFHITGIRENTLEAFCEAKKQGARMIELDVQLSKDGEAIVFHDENLLRMSGEDVKISNLTSEEIKSRVAAPTLLEVLTNPLIPEYINIEIKSGKVKDFGLEKAVARAVVTAKVEKRVLFSSFNPFSLRRMSRLLPNVPRALLASEEKDPKNKVYLRKLWLADFSRAHMLNLEQKMLTEKRIFSFKNRGIKIAAWTVNNDIEAKRLLNLGVSSIISDEPIRI